MAGYAEKPTPVKPSGPSRTRPKGFVPSDGSAALARMRALGNSAIPDQKSPEASTRAVLKIFPTSLVRRRDLSVNEAIERAEWSEYQRERDRSRDKRRGKVAGFSNKSRFRLLEKLGSVGREDPPYMLTLTYRSGAPEAEAEGHAELHELKKWLRRNYPVAGIWRMEVTTGKGTRAKKRTKHYHMLIWCRAWLEYSEQDLELVREDIAAKWCKYTNDYGEDRMRYGVHLKNAGGDPTRAKNYLVGHTLKKTDQEACGSGRHWGTLNASKLEQGSARETIKLAPAQRKALDRVARKLIARRGKGKRRERHLASVRETHLVLDPYQQGKLIAYLRTITK